MNYVAVLLAACLLLGNGLTRVIASQTPSQSASSTPAAAPQQRLRSRIFIYDLRDGSSRLVYTADTIWEAPNWSPDGTYLISNSGGSIYKLPLQADGTTTPQHLAIPPEYRCNNDKAISPDGKMLAFSATLPPAKASNVYLANADGTDIHAMTTEVPSYFHGWSPDGKTLAFVAQRNGVKQFDIYREPAAGGPEVRLISDTHHDDGPDYSPDGNWIYFNSDRSGREAIYRMPPSGAGMNDKSAQLVLADGDEDWFPHPSPDGSKLLYIAYPVGTATHNPRDLQVKLRLAEIQGDNVDKHGKTLATITGGQGTLNVNSWAPDSLRFAYVSYEVLP